VWERRSQTSFTRTTPLVVTQIFCSDWTYQPKPKRRRLGQGTTWLYAITESARGGRVSRYINSYSHCNGTFVLPGEGSTSPSPLAQNAMGQNVVVPVQQLQAGPHAMYVNQQLAPTGKAAYFLRAIVLLLLFSVTSWLIASVAGCSSSGARHVLKPTNGVRQRKEQILRARLRLTRPSQFLPRFVSTLTSR